MHGEPMAPTRGQGTQGGEHRPIGGRLREAPETWTGDLLSLVIRSCC